MKFIVIGKKAEKLLVMTYPQITGAYLSPIREFVKSKSCVVEHVNIEDENDPIVTIRIPKTHPVDDNLVLESLTLCIIKYIGEYTTKELTLLEI